MSPGGPFKYCRQWIPTLVPLPSDGLGLYVMLLCNVLTGLILNANVPWWRAGPHGNETL